MFNPQRNRIIQLEHVIGFLRFLAYGRYPVKQRLSMMADDIYQRFDTENIREDDIPRSYRSTYEIMTFAKRIQNTSLEAVKRHGEVPVITGCKDEREELRQMKKAIRDFETGESTTLGIILKTNRGVIHPNGKGVRV